MAKPSKADQPAPTTGRHWLQPSVTKVICAIFFGYASMLYGLMMCTEACDWEHPGDVLMILAFAPNVFLIFLMESLTPVAALVGYATKLLGFGETDEFAILLIISIPVWYVYISFLARLWRWGRRKEGT